MTTVVEILGKRQWLNILNAMAKRNGEPMTNYAIAKEAGIPRDRTRDVLQKLVALNLVNEMGLEPRQYRLNSQSPTIQALLEVLHSSGKIHLPS